MKQVCTIAQDLQELSCAHGFYGMPVTASAEDTDAAEPDFKEQCAAICAQTGFSSSQLCCVHQVHSAKVVVIGGDGHDMTLKADAMVSRHAGVLLAVKTADCVPALFYDPVARVIGAAHAGWRGALGGILENTVSAMQELGAKKENVLAVIGPAIAQESYEVGTDFKENFLKAHVASLELFTGGQNEKPLFDLPGFCRLLLMNEGVKKVRVIAVNTRNEKNGYFSHRRSCQQPESRYGRNVSVIGLPD